MGEHTKSNTNPPGKKNGDELYEMNKGRAIEGTSSKLFHEIMFHVFVSRLKNCFE